MAKRIVVALKRRDRIEKILPYIEEIAKPGMRVVFLIPYPVDTWSYMRDHWIATESSTKAMLAGRDIMRQYSWDMQTGLAERKIDSARAALRKMEVETTVQMYTGCQKRMLLEYMGKEKADLIMVSHTGGQLWKRVVGKIPLLGFLKRSRVSSVMLLRV